MRKFTNKTTIAYEGEDGERHLEHHVDLPNWLWYFIAGTCILAMLLGFATMLDFILTLITRGEWGGF